MRERDKNCRKCCQSKWRLEPAIRISTPAFKRIHSGDVRVCGNCGHREDVSAGRVMFMGMNLTDYEKAVQIERRSAPALAVTLNSRSKPLQERIVQIWESDGVLVDRLPPLNP